MGTNRPKDRYVRVNGVRLHYLDWGGDDLPALLLLHGLTGNAHMWDAAVRDGVAPRDRYRILALDQRGHGDSDHAHSYAVERFAEDLHAFAARLGLGRYDLLGHSLGARNGMAYAGDHWDELRHLVLVDFGPEMERAGATQVRGSITQRPSHFRTFDEAVAYLRDTTEGRSEEGLREMATHAFRLNYAGRFVWKHDSELSWISGSFGLTEVPYLWRQVESIRCPTLIVRGSSSNVLGRAVMQRMVEAIPGARAVEIADAGHGVPREQPVAFWREVTAFLDTP